MAASVRIEDEAFADIRFKHLGALLGSNEYMALGIMAHLWRACTQLGVHVLKKPLVAQIVNPALLVEAHLAQEVEGGYRIKGTKGRIEWLKEKRKNGRKGGKYGHLGGRPKKTPNGVSVGFQKKPPPAPAPVTAPAPVNQNPLTPLNVETVYDAETWFTRFWEAYPRKGNKPQTREEWDRQVNNLATAEAVISGLGIWKQSSEWTEPTYVPMSASFLRGRRWEDRPVESSSSSKPETIDDVIARKAAERAARTAKP